MFLLLVSFIAGVLTTLAPCILPVLPVIIGGSVQDHSKRNPYLITGALAISVIAFTLLLKFSTSLITIPSSIWSGISGGIIIIFGIISLFPGVWDALSFKLGFSARSEQLLSVASSHQSRIGDLLIGLSLGPVFSSCSPTYFLILGVVLPANFTLGIVYLIVYALGLSLTLLALSLLGQKFLKNARFAANPNGWFKRGLGVLFILVGIFIATGTDKNVQAYLVERNIYPSLEFEKKLLESVKKLHDLQ